MTVCGGMKYRGNERGTLNAVPKQTSSHTNIWDFLKGPANEPLVFYLQIVRLDGATREDAFEPIRNLHGLHVLIKITS